MIDLDVPASDRLLDSKEAARRLGVKISTLYVYVSRGFLPSIRSPGIKQSFYRVEDVEELARRSRGAGSMETRIDTISTSVTQLNDSGPSYRGTPAVSLTRESFENVAALLWQSADGEWIPNRLTLPDSVPTRDILSTVTILSASNDPLRSTSRPIAAIRAAARLIATMASSLSQMRDSDVPKSIASRISGSLGDCDNPSALEAAINAALVLLADDELAISTLAVRLAASCRASLYDSILSGLGVHSGRLYDSHLGLLWRLLGDVAAHGAESAIDEALRWAPNLPGFGALRYPAGDPRYLALKPFVDAVISDDRREALDSLVEAAAHNRLPGPTIDLALCALVRSLTTDSTMIYVMPAIARTAGWVAHYLEELTEDIYRLHLRAIYVTPSIGPVSHTLIDRPI